MEIKREENQIKANTKDESKIIGLILQFYTSSELLKQRKLNLKTIEEIIHE